MKDLSKYIDHTLLKATVTEADIIQLCKEAIEYKFCAVCVNGCYVELCNTILKQSTVKIAAVIGFPLGAMDMLTKINEAKSAVITGASEIDMVMNIGFLKGKKYDLVESEIRKIKNAIGNNILKVIIETCYLTDEEKKTATQLCINAGADFVKTSTGFGTNGATIEDVVLMKSIAQNYIKIKASGGIRDYETALKYIEIGVERIGTSNGIHIISEQKDPDENY
ncbi:MAG: deoxyribose-phosphate aldolase [Chitinophagales bacterium]